MKNTNQENVNQPTDAPETPPMESTEAPQAGSAEARTPKTYTEAEINAIVTARLAKQEKSLRSQLETEAAEKAKRAEMDEVERIKAEKTDIEKALEAERAARTSAERRASLAGKVVDPEGALKLIDEEKHVDENGINVEALLADYPYLAPNQKPAGTTISGAGTVAGSTTRLAALEEQLANAKTRVDRVSIQSQIQELRRKQR